jgi:hypothetical protein
MTEHRTRHPSVLVLAAALAAGVVGAPGGAAAKQAEVRHPEDLFVVDCLLPGRVRSLGRHTKFAAPRKVVRASAHECGLRGGEFSRDVEDNAWALQSWLAQAEAGDAEAMNNVGEIYEQGVRGAADHAQAAAWYRRAAEAGSRRGQRNLAALYEQGLGVPANAEEAVAWYRKAAGLTGPAELSAEREAAALRQELEAARAEAAEARARLASLEGELAGARGALAAADRELADLRSRAAKSEATAVAAKEAEREAKRRQVAELEAAQDRFRNMLAELDAAESAAKKAGQVGGATLLAKRAPAIEFVRPDVLATRGPALAPVGAGEREAEIVGRVTAELGLDRFTVDGRAQTVDGEGYFEVKLPVRPEATVRFVAIDRAARKAEAELRFVVAGGTAPAPAPPPVAAAKPAAGRRTHALIVANGNYRALPALATAHADGAELARVLRDEYGFEVELMKDASFLDTMLALAELGKSLEPQDDLLVYFAGHGRIDEATGRGYWLPADADPEDRSTWLPNDALAKQLGLTAAGHVLVVSDSCYAGTLAASGLEARSAGAGAGRSRTVLASGGLQPVLDTVGGETHSIFARALLSVLKLATDATSASQVASAVAARVGFKAAQLGIEQTPLYAPIRHAGHEAGDFVFVPRG